MPNPVIQGTPSTQGEVMAKTKKKSPNGVGLRYIGTNPNFGVVALTKNRKEEEYFYEVIAHKTLHSVGNETLVCRLQKMASGGEVYHVMVTLDSGACTCKSSVVCKHILGLRTLLKNKKFH